MKRILSVFSASKTGSQANGVDLTLDTTIEVDGKRRVGETRTLSGQGAFVVVPTESLKTNQHVFVQIHLRANKFVRLPARIAAVNPPRGSSKAGIEVLWLNPTADDKARLTEFMSEGARQKQMRAPVKLKATFTWNQQEYVCEVPSITTTGCYLDDHEQVLQPSDKVMLRIHLREGDILEVVGEVMWLAGDATVVAATHVIGSALEFRDLSRTDAARIEKRLAQG